MKAAEQTEALIPQPQSPAAAIDAATMEKVLLVGDLKTLTPRERLSYYDAVCRSLGLNPITQPFAYLNLNGRLVLYAKRECTDQLRKIHNVTLTIKSREVTEGCYVVVAAATLPNGRQDESIGAVPIEGLKGENRANAMMKAESKSKRRCTLCVCGLSFLDETEVGSIRDAQRVTIDPQTGELQAERDPNPSRSMSSVEAGADHEAKPQPNPEAATRPWRNFGGMRDQFRRLQSRLEPNYGHIYSEILHRFNVASPDEFKTTATAVECYNQLLAKVTELEAAARDDTADVEMTPDAGDPPEQSPEPEEELAAASIKHRLEQFRPAARRAGRSALLRNLGRARIRTCK